MERRPGRLRTVQRRHLEPLLASGSPACKRALAITPGPFLVSVNEQRLCLPADAKLLERTLLHRPHFFLVVGGLMVVTQKVEDAVYHQDR